MFSHQASVGLGGQGNKISSNPAARGRLESIVNKKWKY